MDRFEFSAEPKLKGSVDTVHASSSHVSLPDNTFKVVQTTKCPSYRKAIRSGGVLLNVENAATPVVHRSRLRVAKKPPADPEDKENDELRLPSIGLLTSKPADKMPTGSDAKPLAVFATPLTAASGNCDSKFCPRV